MLTQIDGHRQSFLGQSLHPLPIQIASQHLSTHHSPLPMLIDVLRRQTQEMSNDPGGNRFCQRHEIPPASIQQRAKIRSHPCANRGLHGGDLTLEQARPD